MNWSRRFKLAAFGGTALSSVLFVVASSVKTEWLWNIQLPGLFASMAIFGVHGGDSFGFSTLMIVVNALAFTAVMFLLFSIISLRSRTS
jgi:hypothetical protein